MLLFAFQDLIDEVLAAIEMNLESWTIEELSDIVRHYDYDTGEVERYLKRKLEESTQTKRTDDMFDLDEDNSTSIRKTLSFADFSPLSEHPMTHLHSLYLYIHLLLCYLGIPCCYRWNGSY